MYSCSHVLKYPCAHVHMNPCSHTHALMPRSTFKHKMSYNTNATLYLHQLFSAPWFSQYRFVTFIPKVQNSLLSCSWCWEHQTSLEVERSRERERRAWCPLWAVPEVLKSRSCGWGCRRSRTLELQGEDLSGRRLGWYWHHKRAGLFIYPLGG